MKARLHVGATHVRMATQSPQIVFTGALMLPLLRDKGSAAYLARNMPRSKGSVTGQLDLAAMYHVHARHTYGKLFSRYAAEDRDVHCKARKHWSLSTLHCLCAELRRSQDLETD